VAFKLAELFVDIKANHKPLMGGLGMVRNALGSLGSGLGGMVAGVGRAVTSMGGLIAGGALTAGLWKSIQAASDLAETVDFARIVFGDSFGDMNKYADQLNARFGIAKRGSLEMAVGFAGMGKEIGNLKGDKLIGFTKSATQMAIDMASAYNMSTEEAARALQIGLSGNQSDILKQKGVILTDAAVTNYAQEKGIKGKGDLTDQQKFAIRAILLDKALAASKNNLALTEDSVANRQRKAMGMIESAMVNLGNAVIPIWTNILSVGSEAFTGIVGYIQQNANVFAGWVKVIGEGLQFAGFLIANFGQVWQTMGLVAQERLMNIQELFAWLMGAIGQYGEWFAGNWVNLIRDALNAVWTIFQNVFTNITNLVGAAWNYITNPAGGFNFQITPLLSGFEASMAALPEIAAPHLTSLKDEMNAVWADVGEQAAKSVAADPFAGNASLGEMGAGMLADAAGASGAAKAKADEGIKTTSLEGFIQSLQAGIFKDRTADRTAAATEKTATLLEKQLQKGTGAVGGVGAAALAVA
jgi:hypothetical protein